jgi:guanylate kinase
VGKGPLHAALKRLYPEIAAPLEPIVLYNSRSPRPGERDGVDYHFRQREQIEALREKNGYKVMDVRGDLQAIDMAAIRRTMEEGDAFFEGNPMVGSALLDFARTEAAEAVTMFLSPLSREEIEYLLAPERNVALPDFVTDVMRRKLLRRTRRQKGELSLKDLENVERRASSAYNELKLAWRFGSVVPNHDGEDSENWDAFYYPIGDARRALLAFVDLLAGRKPALAEEWDPSLLP